MLFEDILFLLGLGTSIFFIGIPVYKFVKAVLPQKRNRVAEAKARLEAAKAEMEAAKLEKQADQIYEEIYQDALEDNDETNNNRRRV